MELRDHLKAYRGRIMGRVAGAPMNGSVKWGALQTVPHKKVKKRVQRK